jgi:hypothetical protein
MEEKELSPKQHKLIADLVSGKSIKDAAKAVDIAEKTAHVWLKQPLFQQAYQAAKYAAFDERLGMLKDGISIAMKTLLKHMSHEDTPAQVQVRAAEIWIKHSIEIHKMQAVEQRVIELEEKVGTLQK